MPEDLQMVGGEDLRQKLLEFWTPGRLLHGEVRDRLERELEVSVEKRRLFVEHQIFALCLREVFCRHASRGLAVVGGETAGVAPEVPLPEPVRLSPVNGGARSLKPPFMKWMGITLAFVAGVGAAEWAHWAFKKDRRPASVGGHQGAAGLWAEALSLRRMQVEGGVFRMDGGGPVLANTRGRIELETLADSGPVEILTPSGKIRLSSGEASVEVSSMDGIRIRVSKGKVTWIPGMGSPVEIGQGGEHAEPVR